MFLIVVIGACGAEDERCEPPTVRTTGQGCTVEWSGCQGADYEIECIRKEGEIFVVGCQCIKNTVEVGEFTSERYCEQNQIGMTSAGNTGCGWILEIR